MKCSCLQWRQTLITPSPHHRHTFPSSSISVLTGRRGLSQMLICSGFFGLLTPWTYAFGPQIFGPKLL